MHVAGTTRGTRRDRRRGRAGLRAVARTCGPSSNRKREVRAVGGIGRNGGRRHHRGRDEPEPLPQRGRPQMTAGPRPASRARARNAARHDRCTARASRGRTVALAADVATGKSGSPAADGGHRGAASLPDRTRRSRTPVRHARRPDRTGAPRQDARGPPRARVPRSPKVTCSSRTCPASARRRSPRRSPARSAARGGASSSRPTCCRPT